MANSLVITEIRPTMGDVLLSPKKVAERWEVEVSTLASMRSEGRGPRYYKMPNGMVRYPDWAIFDYELGKVAA
jgi:hypothetical protein